MSASNPSISILLPVYNDSSYLVRAVTSMRRQTFQAWELLLLDDGSTDDSPELIDSLAREEPRIRPVHLPHRGIAATLKTGIEKAAGRLHAKRFLTPFRRLCRLVPGSPGERETEPMQIGEGTRDGSERPGASET